MPERRSIQHLQHLGWLHGKTRIKECRARAGVVNLHCELTAALSRWQKPAVRKTLTALTLHSTEEYQRGHRRYNNARYGLGFSIGLCAAILLGSIAGCAGQNVPLSPPVSSGSETTSALEAQIKELQAVVAHMKSQMDQVQAETGKLRTELQNTQARLAALQPSTRPADALASNQPASPSVAPSSASSATGHSANNVQDQISEIKEQQELLKSQVNDQYQTKVESASKYRVRLSGIALLNVFSNRGNVDNQDVPGVAEGRGPLDSNAVFGATVRQSEIGAEVFGPTLAGARTYGEIQMDFFGGFPDTSNGVSTGILRIRTATVQMDWHNTSLVAGQDALFFSPLAPTSFASLAQPALAYSGNLWAWTPQIRVEHHFNLSEKSGVILQGGILDSLTGEPPVYSSYRSAQAGEKSGQPAYATRVAWSGSAFGRPVTVGVGGYYSPQNWGFGRKVNGWAGTADLDVPLGRWFSFSGEFYRGRAIGGLGGGIGRSVLYNGPLTDPATSVLGLNTAGGWAQLKFHPIERLEFNGAFGEDDPFAADIRRFPEALSYYDASTDRNQSGFINLIYHPRSNLILSLEYRRLWTSDVDEAPYRAGQINLGIGVLF